MLDVSSGWGGTPLWPRGETFIVRPDPAKTAKRTIRIARISYDGNWDPEPGGWRRMVAIFHNERATDLDVQPVTLGTGKLDESFALAHLTGTGALDLSEAARKEIRAFVATGGTILFEACGGSGEFATSAEREIAAIAGQAARPQVLPATHPLYRSAHTITGADYRAAARMANPGIEHTLTLQGADVNHRTSVLFSRLDLSVGLVGTSVAGVNGYTPDGYEGDGVKWAGATRIMTNIIVLAAQAREPR